MAKAMGALKDPSKLRKKKDDDSSSDEPEPQKSCYGSIVLKPKNLTYTLWNGFISILTLVQICKTMITLGFEGAYHHVIADFIIDAIYFLDILLRFFTAYIKDVDMETRCWKISLHYITGFFFIDILATCPSFFSYEYIHMYWFKLIRFLRIFRFQDPFRLLIWKTIGRLHIEKSIVHRIISFTSLCVFLLVVVHTLPCCWILIGHKVKGSWIETHDAD